MNNDRNKKVEEILNSLDACQKAVMPGFFYTRLKARMEKEAEPVTKKSWMLRPAFAFTALVAVLFINAAVILQKSKLSNSSNTDTETLQSIAAEYSLNDSNTALFDINQDK